jgi:hypothetical protein
MTGRPGGRPEVIEPARAQRLEATPAVAHPHGDAEDVAELPIEVAQVALRMMDDTHAQVAESGEALGEQAHDDAFARARVAVDEREAALAQVRLLDAPAEVLDLRGHIERLGRHVGGKGVPFQAVQGEQSLVHG